MLPLSPRICQCMRPFFVKRSRPKFLAATSNLRAEQNLVHLGRFLKMVGVTLIQIFPLLHLAPVLFTPLSPIFDKIAQNCRTIVFLPIYCREVNISNTFVFQIGEHSEVIRKFVEHGTFSFQPRERA